MGVRALVIAIENYPLVATGGIARTLTGALNAGLEFRRWLEEKWAAEQRPATDTQMLFCSEPVQPGDNGATRKDILRALLQLKQDGQNATDELYVFFSGHGFSFVQRPGSRVDVVITADFETSALSSDCCLKLDEIIAWLRDHLGPGRHYYFVDACRNPIDTSQIQVGALLPIDPNTSSEASTFVLQSTIEGATAAADSTFSVTLIDGLRGKGKAKTWDAAVPDAMFVRYDSLRQFVKATLANSQPISSRVEGPEGESEAVLATLRPIPLSKCTIQVTNARPHDSGELSIKRGRSVADERRAIGAEPLILEVEPDIYSIALRLQAASVIPGDPMAIDLFDDQTIAFTRGRPALRGPLESSSEPLPTPEMLDAATSVRVQVVVPSGASVSLRKADSAAVQRFDQSARASMPAGRYVATLSSADARTVNEQELELTPGRDVAINLLNWRRSLPHTSIASNFPQASGLVFFSEALPGIVDTDLDLWLAIIGGGRLLGSRGDYSKLTELSLHDFSDETTGASPIYVLAGFDDPALSLRIGVSRDAQVTWTDATEPPNMAGLKEFYCPAEAGWTLVSFAIAGQAVYTVASHASPNRGMLITLTLDVDGRPTVSQYLLPISHLAPNLPAAVRQRLQSRNQLADVRFLAQASRAFRKRHNVAREMGQSELNDLISAKWLDPIASSLAAYELMRRGRRDELGHVVSNMIEYFADLPDTQALAKLSGKDVQAPQGVPLFFDGVRAFADSEDFEQWLPLPASHLDYSSSWTAWRAAVR